MNPTRPCPRCGRQNPGAISFCPACGENLSSPTKRHSWKLLFGALALVVGALWASAIYTQTGRQAIQPQPPVQTFANSNQPAAPPPEQAGLSAAAHLSEARRALADGYKPNKDPKKASWGEVAAARWHLKSIDRSAPEYSEAQELLREVARREKQIELASIPAAAKVELAPETAEAGESDDSGVTSAPAKSSALPASSASRPTQSATAEPPSGRAQFGGSSDDTYTNVEGVQVRRPIKSDSVPAGASAQCRDGSYSFSRNRRGTCSHHGGVARWL
jgi:hypothetical protein